MRRWIAIAALALFLGGGLAEEVEARGGGFLSRLRERRQARIHGGGSGSADGCSSCGG